MLATSTKIGRGFGKNAGEWTGRVEISEEEIPGSKRSHVIRRRSHIIKKTKRKKKMMKKEAKERTTRFS